MSSNGEQDRTAALQDNIAGGADLAGLRERLEQRGERLADAAIWYIGHRVASALAHAHAVTDDEGNPAPAVHLGLRPDDVKIAWDGRVRLINRARRPALAARAGELRSEEPAPEYMAPEQREGARVTHRTDVYRLGLLLWSLLTWQKPPSDGSRPGPLSEARADLPRTLTDALDTALEPAASRRRITCLEIEQWLATIVDASAGERALREHLAALRSPGAKTMSVQAHESASAATRATEAETADETAMETAAKSPTEAEAETETEAEAEAETETESPTSPAPPQPPATSIGRSPLTEPSPPSGPLPTATFVSVALVIGALVVIVGALAGDHLLELAAPNSPEIGDFHPKE